MKQIVLWLLAIVSLGGCTINPPIEETSRENIKSEREAKQSDAFARSLEQ